MTAHEHDQIIDLIKREVILSIGCTEPMAVSLCVAKACETLGTTPDTVAVELSANIFKNAMGVGIPNSGMTGLPIAIALGVVAGRSEYGLAVLQDVDAEAVERAKSFLEQSKPTIDIADESKGLLYIRVVVTHNDNTAEVVISGTHTNFSSIRLNGEDISVGESVSSDTNPQNENLELSLRKHS